MVDPIETAELLAFVKTVDSQSLSRAAAELGVPRATLSRRLARLEARLAARLLRRTTRRLTLTDAGDAFYRHARIVLDAVTHAEASVRRVDSVVRGDLRVSVPPIMTQGFYAMLCDFAKTYPEVRLQVQFSSVHVDLQRDGYDVALRAGMDLEPGLVSRTLARMEMIAVASPAYIAEHGEPRSAKDLKQHRCLQGFARGELPQTHWPLKDGGKIHVESGFVANELLLLGEAAVRGLGIACLPRQFTDPLIQRGALVQVLPGIVGASSRAALVYLEREFVPPQVKAFVDCVTTWARRELATGQAARDQLVGIQATSNSRQEQGSPGHAGETKGGRRARKKNG